MTFRQAVAALTLSAASMVSAVPAQAQWYDDDTPYYERPAWAERARRRQMMRQDRYARPSEYRARRYGRWYDNEYDDEPRYRSRRYRDQWQDTDDDDDEPRASTSKNKQQADSDEVRSGGPRPSIAAKAPPRVALASDFAPGSIVIDQSARKLYYIVSRSLAYRYPISVGREGFSWTGKEKVSRIADWPDWHPPEEMRERDPKLPVKMTGGLNNPLGAKAIYLGNTLYRIHGTNNPKSIGQAASSGCFRMLNEHVLHLAGQVQVGAQVHVMKHLPKTVATAN